MSGFFVWGPMELVPYSKDFLGTNYSWRQEKAACRFNPFQPMTIEELGTKCLQMGLRLEDYRDFEEIRFFALVEGELIGNCGITSINSTMNTAIIGYLVGEKFHGKGYGTEMVSMFLREVFDKTGLRRIEAYIHPDNEASIALAEKLGFKKEGLLRECIILNGKSADNYLYSLLKNEFQY